MGKKVKKAAYVVFRGWRSGVYTSWADTETQVKGFPNTEYKGYATYDEAVRAFENKSKQARSQCAPTSSKYTGTSQRINFVKPSTDRESDLDRGSCALAPPMAKAEGPPLMPTNRGFQLLKECFGWKPGQGLGRKSLARWSQ